MKSPMMWLSILIISCIVISCKSDSTGPSQEQFISGIVKDSIGNPVPNAYLNFNFRFRQSGYSGIVVDTPVTLNQGYSAELGFDLPERTKVKVVLRNYVRHNVVTLVDDTLDTGSWSIDLNLNGWKDNSGRDLYSDIYRGVATIGDSVIVPEAIINLSRAQHLSNNPLPYAQTDEKGRFSIPLPRLPFRETFSFPHDTLRYENEQYLTAFTATKFGRTLISISDPSEATIYLTRSK